MANKMILVLALSVLLFSAAQSQNLHLKIFNPIERGFFPITSTLIYGENDAILIDAQFQKQFALELIEEIKATGKNLKIIYISHRDPDYYFGLDEFKKAFPRAEIVSTAETAYAIEASKDKKVALWAPKIGPDSPTEIVIPTAIREFPLLEGQKLEIIRTHDNPSHSFVWIPSLKAIVGGVSVSSGMHLWMTDAQQSNAIEKWIAKIDAMKALHPKIVIPGHYSQLDTDPAVLDFIRNYLESYKNAEANSVDAESLINTMASLYPALPVDENLILGAKVVKREMEWAHTSPFPAIGNRVLINNGDGKTYHMDYVDNKQLRFAQRKEKTNKPKHLINYVVKEVSSNVFMVSWTADKNPESNVVQVQNWNTGFVFTKTLNTDGTVYITQGTIAITDWLLAERM